MALSLPANTVWYVLSRRTTTASCAPSADRTRRWRSCTLRTNEPIVLDTYGTELYVCKSIKRTFDLVLGVVHQALADEGVHARHVRGRVLVRVEPAGAREHNAPAELVAAGQRQQVSKLGKVNCRFSTVTAYFINYCRPVTHPLSSMSDITGSSTSSLENHCGYSCLMTRYLSSMSWAMGTLYFFVLKNRNRNGASEKHGAVWISGRL